VVAELFVDASAWYPLARPTHHDHELLARVFDQAIRRGTRMVTTNLVVAEAHALLLRRTSRDIALAFLQAVREPRNVMVTSTPELESAAVRDWLERYNDHDFSFADAVSFAVMAERGIREALTLDRHFAAAGFRMVPG
jgi:predicted nucleic acid-binding protein